ncbi:MAG: CrcB family protein [Bacteroidetes bacterium]|nr:CrcB family protein [Bacteroidota bacterium]
MTGFCGGFTTFSAFSKESVLMIMQQQWGMVSLYIVLSIIVCLSATALGYLLSH